MEHELKTDAKVFEAVKLGEKTFEIRKDDRAYAVGDLLILRKTVHTGAEIGSSAVVSRRCANRLLRSIGLNVRRQKVDADEYSMTHKGSRWIDLHGVDSITAAEIIKAANAQAEAPSLSEVDPPVAG